MCSCGNLFILLALKAGVENAKVVGWLLEMRVSDTPTFFSCTVEGSIFSSMVRN